MMRRTALALSVFALVLVCLSVLSLQVNATQNTTVKSDEEPAQKMYYGQKVLALDSDLYMDFYVAVSEAVATDENAKMLVALGGTEIAEIPLSEAQQVTMEEENDWYCWFVCTVEVPVKDITKQISLQLVDSTGNVGDAYTYSVKQYADYLLANSTDKKVLNICQALLDYGAAAEKHFTVRAGGTVADSELANGGDFGTRLDGVTVDDIYKPTKTADITGITCYGTSLVLEADTSIRLYFKTDAQTWANMQVSVNVADAEYSVSEVTNGHAYIEITGIHAADLDTCYKVTLTCGEESATICYSGLSYAWVVMNSNPSDTLANMVKAMYKYWEAAESYNQLPPPEPGDNEFEILPFPDTVESAELGKGKWQCLQLEDNFIHKAIIDFDSNSVFYYGYQSVDSVPTEQLEILKQNGNEIINYQGTQFINYSRDGTDCYCSVSGDVMLVSFSGLTGTGTLQRIGPNQVKVTSVTGDPFFVKEGWVFEYQPTVDYGELGEGVWKCFHLEGEYIHKVVIDFHRNSVFYYGYQNVDTIPAEALETMVQYGKEIIDYQGAQYINYSGDGTSCYGEISGDLLTVSFGGLTGIGTLQRIAPNQARVISVTDNPFFVKEGWIFAYQPEM